MGYPAPPPVTHSAAPRRWDLSVEQLLEDALAFWRDHRDRRGVILMLEAVRLTFDEHRDGE